MAETLILGKKISAGQRAYLPLPVTTMASGYRLEVPVHILNGMKEGPKLLLNAVSHGDAYTGMQVIKRVLESIDVGKLCGTILAIPCANPIAFEWDSRNTPVDMNNLNRNFPGSAKGWFTDQLADVVCSVCREADMLIDWHGGSYGCAINYILMKQTGEALGAKVLDYALAYGLEMYYSGPPAGPAAKYTGTLSDYMLELGKPAIVAEIGAGMDLAFDQIACSAQGVRNVMCKMGMYPGDPIVPKTQYLIKERPLLRPKNGGLFVPAVGSEYLNRTVPKGTLLAQVLSPLTLEVIEEIYAPCDQTVFLSMRSYATKVHPGDYAYILGDLASAEQIHN